MSTLPKPDPQAGAAAEQQAAEARRTALRSLSDGSLTLDELFTRVQDEEPKHQLGHIHARAALLALPRIGQKKASAILDDLGIPHDRKIDKLGARQRKAIIQSVVDRS
jgi:hypothetical protein